MPISPLGIKQATNPQIINDHRIVHAWWVSVFKEKKILRDKATNKIWNVEKIFNIHKLIVEELKKRGLKHTIIDPSLDRMRLPQKLEDILSKLSSSIVIKNFISLVGSNADGRENPEDIDLVIKQEHRSLHLEESFLSGLQPEELNQFHIIYHPEGPAGKNIPLYDLVLVKKKHYALPDRPTYTFPMFGPAPELEHYSIISTVFLHRLFDEVKILTKEGYEIEGFEEIKEAALKFQKPQEFILEGSICSDRKFRVCDIWRWSSTELVSNKRAQRLFFLEKIEKNDPYLSWVSSDEDLEFEDNIIPGKSFQSLKARQGFKLYEFNSSENLYEFWADGKRIQTGVAAEKKYDGFRLQLHKIGNQVKIFTEDRRRDISSILPMLVKEVKALPFTDIILDSETVWYKDNKPIPRHQMMAIIAGKRPLTGEDIRSYVFDILYFKGKDLHKDPWTSRQKALKSALSTDKQHIKRVIPIITTSKDALQAATDKLAALEGSEGAILKVIDSIYPLSGRTPSWAKLKMVKAIKVKVIGKRTKKAAGAGKSKTFLYRGAFIASPGGSKLEPIYAKANFTPKDMAEEEDWTMGLGFSKGKPGDQKYATTYASNIDAKIGNTLVVTPIAINHFKDKLGATKYTWMFPRISNVSSDKPDDINDVKRIAGTTTIKQEEDTIENLFLNLGNKDFPITLEVL